MWRCNIFEPRCRRSSHGATDLSSRYAGLPTPWSNARAGGRPAPTASAAGWPPFGRRSSRVSPLSSRAQRRAARRRRPSTILGTRFIADCLIASVEFPDFSALLGRRGGGGGGGGRGNTSHSDRRSSSNWSLVSVCKDSSCATAAAVAAATAAAAVTVAAAAAAATASAAAAVATLYGILYTQTGAYAS